MMAEYTPTTDQVRDAWVWMRLTLNQHSYTRCDDEFDRWLAAHDAEIRADERKHMAPATILNFRRPLTERQVKRIADAVAARGGEQA